MASTILVSARPAPPSGVTVNLTGSCSGDGGQVPRRGTCKGVRAGSGWWATMWGRPRGRCGAAAGRVGGRSSLEAEAAGEVGAAVLEVVEAGGDASDVEGPIGVEGPVGLGGAEPVEMRAEEPIVDLAGPLGQPAELPEGQRRHLGAPP